jgi:hypothetical protein
LPPAVQHIPPPERSRKTWIPIVVLLAVLLFGGAIYGGRVIIQRFGQFISQFTSQAEVVETHTFPLSKGATVTVKGYNGSVTLEAWDRPEAEIILIRRGSSEEAAREVPVKIDPKDNSFTIEEQQGPGNSSVSFHIKLPRDLGAVTVSSINGSIKLAELAGTISAESTNGSINLSDVSGLARVETTNGSVRGEVISIAPNQPISIATTNGSIDVDFPSGVNAELTASSTHGSVRVDNGDFPDVRVTRIRNGGGQASGRMGDGGQPLSITSTNGSIRISK